MGRQKASPSRRYRRIGSIWVAALAVAALTTAQEPDPGPEDPPVGADVNDALVVSQNLPDAMYCGDTESFTIRLENVGTGDWTEDGTNGHRLGVTDNDDPFRSNGSKVRLPAGTTIAPGQRHTFTVELTAPETHGVVRTEWQMAEQGVEWFGSIVFKDINVVCGDHAVLAAEAFPTAMNCSSEDEATVTLQNLGSTDWTDAAGFYLANVGTSDAFNPSGAPVRLPSNVTVGRGGGQYPFKVPLQAPSDTHQNDVMTLWQMEHNGEPFGPLVTARIDVDCVNAATRVSDTLPDSMTCGSTLVREVTLRNGGSKPWTAAGGHQLGVPGDTDPFNPSGARVHLPASLAIEENDSHTFDVSLVAPETATTLTTEWQMVENGQWFGEKVSKTITVVCQDAAQAIGHNLPSQMACGEVGTYAVTMKNTGDTVWTRADGYKLGPTGGSDPFRADATRVQLPTSASIAPQSQHSFSVALTAPSQPGSYVTEWQMVNEGVGWFGVVVSHPIEVTCQTGANDADIVSANVPSPMALGSTHTISVSVANNGTSTWQAGTHRLAVDADLDFFPASVELPAGAQIDESGSHSFVFEVTIPTTATLGNQVIQWQMETVSGDAFGETESTVVKVVDPSTALPMVDSELIVVPLGAVTRASLTGSGLSGAEVSFARPATGDPASTPLASAVTSSGQQLAFDVDTRGATETGFHVLTIETAGGVESALVRVLAPGPVVDTYTPSEVARGETYVLHIVGANLGGGSISTSSSGIQLHSVHAETNGISAVLSVEDDASTGERELSVMTSAGSVSLPLRVLASLSGGSPATRTLGGARFQTPATYGDFTNPKSTIPENAFFAGCYDKNFRYNVINHTSTQLILEDLQTAAAVLPGDVVNLVPEIGRVLDATVLQTHARIEVEGAVVVCVFFEPLTGTFEWGYNIDLCIRAEARITIPLVRGYMFTKEWCFGVQREEPPTETEPTGDMESFSVRHSDACVKVVEISIVDGEPEDPNRPPTGVKRVEVAIPRDCGCEQGAPRDGILSARAIGSGFTDFDTGDEDVADTHVTCATSCTGEEVEIEIRTFIPTNRADPPGFALHVGCFKNTSFLPTTFSGDDRWLDPNPAPQPLPQYPDLPSRRNRFRTQQTLRLRIDQDQEPLVLSSSADTGTTFEFEKLSTLAGDNRVDFRDAEDGGDHDGVLGDCHLLHRSGAAPTDKLRWTATATLPGHLGLLVTGEAGDPLVAGAAPLGYSFQATFRRNSDGSLTWAMNGAHDCQPAFEVYINDDLIHHYPQSRPQVTDPNDLWHCLGGNLEIETGLLEGEIPCTQ